MRSLVDPSGKRILLTVVNLGEEMLYIHPGETLAVLEHADCVVQAVDVKNDDNEPHSIGESSCKALSEHLAEVIRGCDEKLSKHQCCPVAKLLEQNQDAFTAPG